jgi:hypothetical protein
VNPVSNGEDEKYVDPGNHTQPPNEFFPLDYSRGQYVFLMPAVPIAGENRTKVQTVLIRIVTGYTGTNGDVYLGLGGREFRIDSKDPGIDDFKINDDTSYWMGIKPSLLPPDSRELVGNPYNLSPYKLTVGKIQKFPVYIRFEGEDDSESWSLRRVEVRVNPKSDTQDLKYVDPARHPPSHSENEYIILIGGGFLFLMPADPIASPKKK